MTWFKIAMIGVAAFAAVSMAFSLVHPWGDLRGASVDGTILQGSPVPPEVRSMIKQKCGDCHSNQTHWPAYSRLAPGSWLMERDVHEGRLAMNLSEWPAISADDRIALLAKIAAEARSGEMPTKPYLVLHAANRLSESDKQQLIAWTRAERKRLKLEASAQKGSI